MNKKNILFIYPEMMVGGSTTSLLSILNLIDYNKYNVDIQFQYSAGTLFQYIPSKVNVLPFAYRKSRKYYKYKKIFSFASMCAYFKAKKRGGLAAAQYMQQDIVKYADQNTKQYDVAISFLELWSMYYLVNKVFAKKKISWIHVDYDAAHLFADIDLPYFYCVDKLIFVSKNCLENFKSKVPEVASKAIFIENILDATIIRSRANQPLKNVIYGLKNAELFKFVSVCRISFNHKGLDRGVMAFYELKKSGKLENVIWYIIGDGPDYIKLRALIDEYKLNEHIILLGEHHNPLIIEKYCDVFFLPSHYEGKPMAVTEAQMLGLVPLITDISSANEIINNYFDGIICENTQEGIFSGLNYVLSNKDKVKHLYHKNVLNTNYTNIKEFQHIENLLDL